MAEQCSDCGGDLRMRYPGGDPENGPARMDCEYGHAEAAEVEAFWEELASHPDDCPCEHCEFDRDIEKQEQEHRARCAARPGGHRWVNALDGDGESGPMGVEIVCGDCHTTPE